MSARADVLLWAQRVIAREIGVSRNTVRRLLAVYIGARRKAPPTRFCSNGFFT